MLSIIFNGIILDGTNCVSIEAAQLYLSTQGVKLRVVLTLFSRDILYSDDCRPNAQFCKWIPYINFALIYIPLSCNTSNKSTFYKYSIFAEKKKQFKKKPSARKPVNSYLR